MVRRFLSKRFTFVLIEFFFYCFSYHASPPLWLQTPFVDVFYVYFLLICLELLGLRTCFALNLSLRLAFSYLSDPPFALNFPINWILLVFTYRERPFQVRLEGRRNITDCPWSCTAHLVVTFSFTSVCQWGKFNCNLKAGEGLIDFCCYQVTVVLNFLSQLFDKVYGCFACIFPVGILLKANRVWINFCTFWTLFVFRTTISILEVYFVHGNYSERLLLPTNWSRGSCFQICKCPTGNNDFLGALPFDFQSLIE